MRNLSSLIDKLFLLDVLLLLVVFACHFVNYYFVKNSFLFWFENIGIWVGVILTTMLFILRGRAK